MMMAVSGCGHQVTGLNQPGGGGIAPSGQTIVRFETAGPLDFSNYNYLIVFNTTGNNRPPLAQGTNSNYTDWTFGFQFSGGGTTVSNSPTLFQFYQNAQAGQTVQQITRPYLVGQQVVVNPTFQSALSLYGFEFRFDRCLFDRPPPVVGATPAPTVAPSPAPSTTPTPAPGGDGLRRCPPFVYTTTSTSWTFNLFTLDRSSNVSDALFVVGSGTTPSIDTTQTINTFNYVRPAGNPIPSVPSAQITGVEVFNTP
ncbi:hypothetical protein [Vulcanimicrobium alpinum]|uniref:hypothetical protein n=1 Tax=Vulcanimicrobium alpinum TaxID=3016050 RepID=UPI00295E8D2E|nr:hypothetical protein [Vulcanimicrobium alpinum]